MGVFQSITDIEYQDASGIVPIDEYLPDEEDMYTPDEDGYFLNDDNYLPDDNYTYAADDGDSYEPNNSFAAATTISANRDINATIHSYSDVDYYSISCSSGILDVSLKSIPYGCDYRFEVYDSSKNKIGETTASGYSAKKASVVISRYGKYFIKVYSKSGYSKASQYSLTASTRSSYITFSGTIKCDIKKEAGHRNTTSVAIPDLPISIVYTARNSNSLRTIKSTTTSASGYFSITVSLPSDADHLFIKAYPDDANLSVQLLDQTVGTWKYEIPFNASKVTVNTYSTNISEQVRASMSLWRLGKMCLETYRPKGDYYCKKLNIRCTAGTEVTTAADRYGNYICINGLSVPHDYYDSQLLLHEMGHWVLTNLGGRPSGAGGKHNWYSPSSPAVAYYEGWAHFFSCSMRNVSTVYDYRNDGNYFGADLESGYVKSGYTTRLEKFEKLSPYASNMSVEVFTASALWNFFRKIVTSYRKMESIAKTPRKTWQEFYDAYMDEISTYDRKTAWEICERFNIAFDMDVPKVSLSISNQLVASMTATDNISVQSYEWYVDGKKRASGVSSSNSLDLKTLNLSAGAHTLECRVYDPEGLATGERPRSARYGSASKAFSTSKTASTSVNDLPILPNMIELQPDSVQPNNISLPLGDEYSYAVNSSGDTDITISMAASNAVKSIDVYTPAGEVYESLSYIAPDAPYTIKDAQSGEWLIKITNYSADEIAAMAYEQGDQMAYSATYDLPATAIQLKVATVPTTVVIDAPEITNNPNILAELFVDGNIILTEGGQVVDPITTPLVDGIHEISAVREIDGMRSEKMDYTIAIDTIAPEIVSLDFPSSTSRDRFLLQADFSENVAGVSVNGEYFELSGCGGASSRYVGAFMLEPGINDFSLTIIDYAGNSSCESFSVERLT